MDRRSFLKSTALTTTLGLNACQTDSRQSSSTDGTVFRHGVASGDPTMDRVIIWSRVTPAIEGSVSVGWWLAEDADASRVVARGTERTSADRDYTVKVDVAGLEPGREYFYGFEAFAQRSITGRTRTLPGVGAERLRLAVTSCANLPNGYFNGYAAIAEADLDVVLSLGDYLYEYADGAYGSGVELDRVPMPDREIVSLADYRERHAQHKAEADLMAAHAAHPWVVVWDDHESANDSWRGGAQNHNPESGEGAWAARKAAAIRAYYEWMPIREVPAGLYRAFRAGDLVDLVMLDTRLAARDEQGEGDDLETANAPGRSLLGPVQEAAFFERLSAAQDAGVRWKVVGQQVAFAPWTDGTGPFNPDSWDGYRHARGRVIEHLERQNISGTVVLTGDVHSSWAMEVPGSDPGSAVAIELIAPAVSSPPLATVSERLAGLIDDATERLPHVRYAEGRKNGYLSVEIARDEVIARWHYTGDRKTRDAGATVGQTLRSALGSNRLG